MAQSRWGFGVQIPRNQFGFIWSKLNPYQFGFFEANWILTNLDSLKQIKSLGWTLACILVLQIISSPFFFKNSIFWFQPIDFSFKMVPCKFSHDLPLFGLGPWSKGATIPFTTWVEEGEQDMELLTKSFIYVPSVSNSDILVCIKRL